MGDDCRQYVEISTVRLFNITVRCVNFDIILDTHGVLERHYVYWKRCLRRCFMAQEKKRFLITLDAEVADRLDAVCSTLGVSRGSLVTMLMINGLPLLRNGIALLDLPSAAGLERGRRQPDDPAGIRALPEEAAAEEEFDEFSEAFDWDDILE